MDDRGSAAKKPAEGRARALWHTLGVDAALAALDTRPGGLSTAEAAARLAAHGPNELVAKRKRTVLAMFLDQFKDFMIVVLIGAAVLAGALGEVADTVAIVVIVVLNAALGFTQEYRAEKAMEALQRMAASLATVVRDGVPAAIPAAQLVPGDQVRLEAGNVVPADLRLTETAKLKVEEAALTGESVPSEKQTGELADAGLPIGDRKNLAYKGTIVTYGRGVGVVIATGMRTELGRIATMLQDEEEGKTPLQKRLVAFGKKLAVAILAICALVFGFGVLRGEPPLLMLLTAVSLAVAAIPEALPAVITISLALGAKKMVRQNALVRKLPAVETLGSVTYICSDKTGTLTMNRMTAEEVYADERLICKDELQGATRPAPAAPGDPAHRGGSFERCQAGCRRRGHRRPDRSRALLAGRAERFRQDRPGGALPAARGAAVRRRAQADDDLPRLGGGEGRLLHERGRRSGARANRPRVDGTRGGRTGDRADSRRRRPRRRGRLARPRVRRCGSGTVSRTTRRLLRRRRG